MPLSSFGLGATALNNIQRTAELAPMPLDAIEERRAARTAEQIEKHKAVSHRINATTYADSVKQAKEAARKQEELQQALRDEWEGFKNTYPITAPVGTPQHTQQYKALLTAAYQSPYAATREQADKMAKNLKAMMESAGIDTGTAYGADIQSQNQRRTDSTANEQSNINLRRRELEQDIYEHKNPIQKPGRPRTYFHPSDPSKSPRAANDNSEESRVLMAAGYVPTDVEGDTSSLTSSQVGKELQGYYDAVETFTVIEGVAGEAIEMLQDPDTTRGAVGAVYNFVESAADQIYQISGKAPLSRPFIEGRSANPEILSEDPERLSKATRSALINGKLDANIVTLAFMNALINNPDGRISDADVRAAKSALKSDQGSVPVMINAIQQTVQIAKIRLKAKEDRVRRQNLMPQTQGQKPVQDMTMEEMQQEYMELQQRGR